MGFYANIRSDVSLVKKTIDKIFTSKSHTCHSKDFICIQSFIYTQNFIEQADYWYHVYRIDDFTMKFVRCERTAIRSNGSYLGYLGPAYYTETDDIFEVNMLEMLDSKNRTAYQEFIDNITLYLYSNIRVAIHSYPDSSSRLIDLELSTHDSLFHNPKFYYCNPKFLFEKIY